MSSRRKFFKQAATLLAAAGLAPGTVIEAFKSGKPCPEYDKIATGLNWPSIVPSCEGEMYVDLNNYSLYVVVNTKRYGPDCLEWIVVEEVDET